MNLDISQAVPMGLILNEAITDSIKYAFNKTGGEILLMRSCRNQKSSPYLLVTTTKGCLQILI